LAYTQYSRSQASTLTAAATYGPAPRGRHQGNPTHYNNYYTVGIWDSSGIVHTEQTGEI